jgi:hypothetical protein
MAKKNKVAEKGDIRSNAPDEVLYRSASIEASTFNDADNSVDVIFLTDEPVLRYDWDSGGLFEEVLSFDPEHIRADRAKGGLPLLDNHDRYGSVTEQLGKGRSVQFDTRKKQATATAFISKRDELKGFSGDVKAQLIDGISGGYRVYQYRDISEKGATRRRLLAIDWEPLEISFTQVQADHRSRTRAFSMVEGAEPGLSADVDGKPGAVNVVVAGENENNRSAEGAAVADKNKLNNNTRSITMDGQEQENKNGADPVAQDQARAEGTRQERNRVKEIRDSARAVGLDEEFVNKHIDEGTSVDEFNKAAIRSLADKQQGEGASQTTPVSRAAVIGEDGERRAVSEGLREVMQIRSEGVRSLGKDGPKTEIGKQAANGREYTMVEMARNILALDHGHAANGWSPNEVFERAMASGDYPAALGETVNKSLRRTYENAQPLWKTFATEESFSDFKKKTSIEVDGDFEALEITEEGEYQYATLKEGKDTWSIGTYGRMIKFTRKMMINDDLGAFTKQATIFAQGVVDMEAKIMYGLLFGNPGSGVMGRTLGDGDQLFSVAKGNMAATGGALNETTLSAARLALRKQKSLAGHKLKITPSKLWIPSDLETQADKILTSVIVAAKTADTNVFKGKLESVVDDYLADYTTTGWFMTADQGEADMLKYGSLQGQKGIFTAQKFEWQSDALLIKVRKDFGGTAEDRRGLYYNPGA